MTNQDAINALSNEVRQLQIQLALMQAKVADAATPTGNEKADEALAEVAKLAANTIVMLGRQIDTRNAMLTALGAPADAPDGPTPDEIRTAAIGAAAKAITEQASPPSAPAFVINADPAPEAKTG